MATTDADAEKEPVDWISVRVEYETTSIAVRIICRTYKVSYTALYHRAHIEKWKLRSPRRVDKGDLIERMLRIIELETEDLEMQMMDDKSTGNEAATLNRLATTLDRLISLQSTEKGPPRRRTTKAMQDIRKKVAHRLIELNGK